MTDPEILAAATRIGEAAADESGRGEAANWVGVEVLAIHELSEARIKTIATVVKQLPTNWCDSLLTGKNKVLPDAPSYSPQDVERLILAIKQRITSLRFN